MSIALELNWQSDVNRYADGTNPAEWLAWYLAKGLSSQTVSGITAGLWTVIASSDGTTADENDNWGDTFDAAKIVAADPGTAHSWILMESPAGLTGGPYYMLVDCSHVDHPEAVRIVFTAEAFDLGSLTTENAPVTTDSEAMMVFNTNTRNVASSGVFLGDMPSLSQHFAHLRVASTGEFVFNTNYNLQGAFYSHIHFLETRNTQPSVDAFNGDTKPLQALALGGGIVSAVNIDGYHYSPLGGNLYYEPNYPNISVAGRVYGASATSAKIFAIPYPASAKKQQYVMWSAPQGYGEDAPWNFLWYNLTTGQLLGLAITCFSSKSIADSTISNYRGRIADVYTAGPFALIPPSTTPVLNQGDVAPIPEVEGGPFLFIKIGAFWFPWNNSEAPFI